MKLIFQKYSKKMPDCHAVSNKVKRSVRTVSPIGEVENLLRHDSQLFKTLVCTPPGKQSTRSVAQAIQHLRNNGCNKKTSIAGNLCLILRRTGCM